MPNRRISELADGGSIQSTDKFVVERSGVNYAVRVNQLTNAIGLYQSLPQLRGFWPMSSVNESGNVYDLSGQGRTLTNTGSATFGVDGLVPYSEFGGSNYFRRSDEAGLDSTGALTLGAWVYKVATYGSVFAYVLGKWSPYLLTYYQDRPQFLVQDSGGTNYATPLTLPASSVGVWEFVVGRYTPSTEIKVFQNNASVTNTTSIPASLPNTTTQLLAGITGQKRITLAFLCATALSDDYINTLYESTRGLFGV